MKQRPLALVRGRFIRSTLTAFVLLAFVANLTLKTAHMKSHDSGSSAPNVALTGFIVNSTGDGSDISQGNGVCETGTGNGICTLRAAIQEANAFAGDDIITFSIPNTDPGCTGGVCTINIFSFLSSLNSNISINGPGASLLTVRRDNSAGNIGVFFVGGGTVTLSGMTISNASQGHGIFVSGGPTLNITNCVVTGNAAGTLGGGALYSSSTGPINITNSTFSSNSASGGEGGAIRQDGTGALNINGSIFSGNSATNLGCLHNNNTGTMNVTNTFITGNTAQFDAGGINNGNNGPGTLNVTNSIISNNTAGNVAGGIKNGGNGVVTIVNSTIDNNTALTGGGIFNVTTGTINVTRSTISNNTSSSGSGGGIFNDRGTINVTNSTLSTNHATGVGGAIAFINFNGQGTGNITASTITGNNSGTGGGVGVQAPGPVTLQNSIISGNTAFNPSPNISGTFISGGYNLIGNNAGGTMAATTGDQIGTSGTPINPQLGSLQNNGGPTFTHALQATSPAIDAGNAFTLTTDQRGFTRTVDDPTVSNVSDGTDIGAFETGNWVWTGSTSADWSTSANWFSGTVPPAWATAVVPTSGVTNNPSLNTPSSQQGLIVETGRTMTLSDALTISGVLDLPGGLVNAGTFTLTLDANAVVNRTGGYVIGNLRKIYNSGANTFSFPVGTANGYSPVAANTTAGSGAGELTVKAVQSSHPQLNPATSLKRYWTLTGTGITVTLTFNYLDPLDISGNESNYRIMKITGSSLVSFSNSCPASPCVAPAGNTATINNVSSFSDWTLGEGAGPTAIEADISGRVVYAGGKPMRGMLVTLFNLNTSQTISTRTDAKGRYRFPLMATGTDYIIMATGEGYDFTPANRFYTHLNAIADLDFVATRSEQAKPSH